jgi:hypothetical protein
MMSEQTGGQVPSQGYHVGHGVSVTGGNAGGATGGSPAYNDSLHRIRATRANEALDYFRAKLRGDDEDSVDNTKEAAEEFLKYCGLDPTPDAVDQLVEAFLPALRIMIERGYDPTGKTWRDGGWRGLVYELRKKIDRLWYRSWLGRQFDKDMYDVINYAGFYIRLKCHGEPWGTKGEPDTADHVIGRVAMGDYSDIP